ncbi:unnamed protein product [Cyberlindnera jadinii]|uniref:Uncharacterized protein n=2 Tax=Cyberlindnera jadinii (strain ATCC 18201 / CBS 1600 / BCRC 20928 / JCM 3617 / NBRC 0987 / NRRL Y-1542) TaxID=983966 RepID=A0A0H5CIV8_CYBJN|nr:unnamed protein product [Cyberlindnera jadinii]
MVSLEHFQLLERDDDEYCYGYSCSSSWEWARWIFFVLFIIALIALLMTAFRINRRRGRQGIAPIRGTAWMTPPSYYQAQNTRQDAYVPPYTEQTNDQDMGYYDNQGVFHMNDKVRQAPSYHLSTLVPDETGVSAPQTAATLTRDPNSSFDRDFNRYYAGSGGAQANPVSQQQGQPQSQNIDVEEDLTFTRPTGPPPAHTRK